MKLFGRKSCAVGEEQWLDDKHVSPQYRYTIHDKDLGKIHKAAILGNVTKVQHVLFIGKNELNDRDKANRTALHLASAFGHLGVITLLAERKCQIDLLDTENRTALVKAVQYQREECVNLLLEHGANPNLKDVNGNTALHYAVCGENLSIVQSLMNCNAYIEAKNQDDLTPLLFAISENQPQMVEYLIQRKANVNAVDKGKRTALMLAVNYDPAIVKLLLQQHVDVLCKDSLGWTAEDYAIVGHKQINGKQIADYRKEMNIEGPSESDCSDEKLEDIASVASFCGKSGHDSWPNSDLNYIVKLKHHNKIKNHLRKKRPKWMSEETLKIALERKEAKGVSDSIPPNYVVYPPEPTNKQAENKVNEHIKEIDLNLAADEEQIRLDKSECGQSEEEAATSAIGKKESVDNLGNALRQQGNNENLTNINKEHTNTNTELDLNLATDEEQKILDKSDSGQLEVAKENSKSSEVKVSENIHDLSVNNEDYGLKQEREAKSIYIENKLFPVKNDEESDRVKKGVVGVVVEDVGKEVVEEVEEVTGVVEDIEEIVVEEEEEAKAEEGVLKAEKIMEGGTTSATINGGNGMDSLANAAREQGNNENLTNVGEAHKITNNILSTGLGEKDDSSWKFEIVSDSVPPNYVVCSPEPTNRKAKIKLNEHMKDLSAEIDLNIAADEETKGLDKNKNDQSEVGKENKIRSSELKVSEHINDPAASNDNYGLNQQGKSINNDKQQCPAKKNEGSDRNTPMLNTKEKKKHKSKKWTSRESTATQVLEQAISEIDVLLQVNDDRNLNEIDWAKARCVKKELNEKSKLEEAQNAYTEAEQRAEKMQEHLKRLEVENEQLKAALRMQMSKAEHLQKNLLGSGLLEEAQNAYTEAVQHTQMTKEHLQRLEIENEQLKITLKMQMGNAEHLQQNLVETISMDDHKGNLREWSSIYLHLAAKYQALQQELLVMKTVKKKCESLEKNKKKLEQEIVNLRSQLEGNRTDYGQVEQYKREIEARVRQEIEEKLKEVNFFLQTQAISQEYIEKLRGTNNASGRTQMQLRIKELESELCKVKTDQEDFTRAEMKKYKQLYQDELNVQKAMSNKLNNTNEKLGEMNSKLLREKPHDRWLLSTLSTRPIPESPCAASMSTSSLLDSNLTSEEYEWITPKEHIRIPSCSKGGPSNDNMNSYLSEMWQELGKDITGDLQKDDPELESLYYTTSTPGYLEESTQELLTQASEESL
ncbi:PREDICTED: ankyrin repeat domain-containing protein 26-like [Elephantulus edwardii]|uniref:ankyrin repeat domain-containing protein 26-like n=1 Tax=Elephantulus edwardii TaxID=28737 RepID=UPI0003F0CE7F|nr:PREDICTED: ankyrin repeat domain-containing protein 26-like [Elephantulus edwardii]